MPVTCQLSLHGGGLLSRPLTMYAECINISGMLDMQKMGDRQGGFSPVEMLVVVVVVVVLAAGGWVVYRHQKGSGKPKADTTSSQTTSQQQASTTSAPQQPATTLATYTSSYGGFSFQYPSNWKVTEAPLSAVPGTTAADMISIDSQTNIPVANGEDTIPNVFRVSLSVSLSPDNFALPRAIPYGTERRLANGINLWVADTAHSAYTEHSGTTASCPTMRIVSANSTHFGYPLPNGKYLGLEGSYCGDQGAIVDLSYQQQLASPDWQAAVTLLQSMKFQ